MQIAHFMPAFTNRFFVLLVLLAGLDSQALTLGRVQGAALIGRSLDVSIQVQMDPGQSMTSACFEADVFHADSRQNPARVKVQLEPTQAPQTFRLRILSESLIDEPVVTVYLRAGCDQMVSRRYVLLADIVSEQSAPIVPRFSSAPLVVPPAAGVRAATAAPAVDAVSPRSGGGAQAKTAAEQPPQSGRKARPEDAKRERQRAAPAKPVPAKPVPAKVPASKAAEPPVASAQPDEKRATGQSRLKLDPLELLSERVATLESTTVNAQTEAAARDAKRLEALETSIKTLVALAARNEASLLDMRTRLQQAQQDRISNTLVYVLAALLLASLLVIIYLLLRRQRQDATDDNWWDGSDKAAPTSRSLPGAVPLDSAPAPFSAPAPLSQPDSLPPATQGREQATQQMTQGLAPRGAPGANTQVDVSLVEMSESTFDRLMQSGAVHSAVRRSRDFAPSVPVAIEPSQADRSGASGRRINSEELFDIRQRAEFFVSLGQTDQAVQVLESRIAQEGESSPQAYLDLLKLFHSLGLKADYGQVRQDFSAVFNAQIPEFADFVHEGRPLEEYPGTVDRLIAAWSTPGVLDLIEALLYRVEPGSPSELFDLQAFRDLLTLHAVAQGVRSGIGLSSGAFRAPLPVIDHEQSLDIDLTELIKPDQAANSHGSSPVPTLPAVQSEPVKDEPAGNLIDFDLSELPFDKPPAKGR